MNFGVRREEALFIRDLIIEELSASGEEVIKKLYGNIDIRGMLRQLHLIIELGDSVDEEPIFKGE